jgi:hypothetical protein
MTFPASYFPVIDERYPNMVSSLAVFSRQGPNHTYCFGRG